MSATPKPTEEEAAHSDASQDLLVSNAEEKKSDSQPSTDVCVRQNEGIGAAHQNTVDITNDLHSERNVNLATQEYHDGSAVAGKVTLKSTDGSKQSTAEHRVQSTDTTSAEEGEAATILLDENSDVFDDSEDVEEGTLQSQGDIDAPDDAESEDGFGGFEEADAGSLAEGSRGNDEDCVEPEAGSFYESNTPKLIPAASAAGSNTDMFTTGRADFYAQVRRLLCPSAVTAIEQEGNEKWPCISLDPIIQQLASSQTLTKSDASCIAVHASVIGANQGQYHEVTPIKWEGSEAERRFLSRFARSKVESSARQQPSTGHQHGQRDNAGSVDIFKASGAVVNGENLAGCSGAERHPVENGDHPGIAGLGSTQAPGNVEIQGQPALDTSGFGAWATDPTLIPGVPTSSNTGTGREGPTPAANSAALAHLERRVSPQRGSDRRAGASPSPLRSSSSAKAQQTGGKQLDMSLPDLSFMLSETLVLPR